MNSCPWDVPDFNVRKPSPLMHYTCTTDAISAKRVLSALPEKLNCAQEWPVLGIRECLSLSEFLGHWDFGIIRNSVTSWKRAVHFKSEEIAGFSTFLHKTEVRKHSLPSWSCLSIWYPLIIFLFVWCIGVYIAFLIIWIIYEVSFIYY